MAYYGKFMGLVNILIVHEFMLGFFYGIFICYLAKWSESSWESVGDKSFVGYAQRIY